MPRVTTPKIAPDEMVVKKRAPRKRVASVSPEGSESEVRPRRAAPKRKEVSEAVVASNYHEDAPAVRRAPTPLRAERQASRHSAKVMIVTMVVLLGTVGAGVLIGISDKGPIDVIAVVNERNEKIGRGEVRGEDGESVTRTVPVQNSDTRPNGGLVPAEVVETPPPAVEESKPDTTASSSESVAGEETDSAPSTPETESEVTEEETTVAP